MNAGRRAALTGLMFGASDFIPERDLAIMLGDNCTDVQKELREMELDGLAERQEFISEYRPYASRKRFAWRRKP